MRLAGLLRCPAHASSLLEDSAAQVWRCKEGCSFPIVGDIPRFVPSQAYASSFGLQWNEFQETQLDSFSGSAVSRDRLARIAGGSLSCFLGKLVLEAGCGAGRFTEVMLSEGAHVVATDISSAVDANQRNCVKYPQYFVCQADVRALPFPAACFDVVVCVGVVQHTPDPEQTMSALCRYLKPGGLLLMDHYAPGYPEGLLRRGLRAHLLRTSPETALRFCRRLASILWPIHVASWQLTGRFRWTYVLRRVLLRISPVVDYQDAYPQLGSGLLREWAILDTHDTLTDCYKHLRSADEISAHLRTCGMIGVETAYAGNGVEVRAIKAAPDNPEEDSSVVISKRGSTKGGMPSDEVH